MKPSIRPGQLMVLLCTAAAPGLLRGHGSLSGLLAGALLLTVTPLLLSLPPHKRVLPGWCRTIGLVILGLFFLWEAIRTAAELGRFAAGTEQSPTSAPLLAAALILAAAWGASQGIESAARAAGLWAAAGIVLLVPVTAALLPHITAARLSSHWLTGVPSPWADSIAFLADFGGLLAILWLLRIHAPALRPLHGLILSGSVLLLSLVCTGIAIGMLGDWATVRTEPLYTATLSVPPGTTFRPDSLYTVVRIAAHYCRGGVFLLGFYLCLKTLHLHPVFPLAGTAGALLLSMWLTRHPDHLTLWIRLFRWPGLALGLGLPLLAGRRKAV